jgi:hypothetical protein
MDVHASLPADQFESVADAPLDTYAVALFATWRVAPNARLLHEQSGALTFSGAQGSRSVLRLPRIRQVVLELEAGQSVGAALIRLGIPQRDWNNYAREVVEISRTGFLVRPGSHVEPGGASVVTEGNEALSRPVRSSTHKHPLGASND